MKPQNIILIAGGFFAAMVYFKYGLVLAITIEIIFIIITALMGVIENISDGLIRLRNRVNNLTEMVHNGPPKSNFMDSKDYKKSRIDS